MLGRVAKNTPRLGCSLTRSFETKAVTEEAAGCPHQATVTNDEVDWENAKPYKDIPGPSKFELVRGFMPGGEFYQKPVTKLFETIRKKYGEFTILPGVFGKKAIVMTYDPDVYRKVFRNEGIWPERRNFDSAMYYRQVYKKDYFKGVEGMIMTSGEPWARFRKAVNPILMQPRNAKQYLTKMLPVNDEFLQRIREIRDPKTLEMPETFLDDINRLTFESVAVIALDQQTGLIRRNRDRPEAEILFKSLKDFFDLAYVLDIQPSMWKIIKTPAFYKMMKTCDQIFEITSKYIDEALARIEKHPCDDYDQKSVVEKLSKTDKHIAVVMATDLLMAGVDTTTTTLVGILFGIGKNPDKQEKLREEIRKVLPQKDSVLTVDSLKDLPYLRACIKEGIRLFPIGPGTVRTMVKDIVLKGYQVPKGTDIAMANNIILRDEKYFPRPNDYIPERWLRTEEGAAYKADEVNPFVYLPFGFGPRSCAGKRIVELELELTVMRLVRNFNIEFNYSIENAFKTEFMTRPVIPLKFKFAEVEN